jgi:hypothetical protein
VHDLLVDQIEFARLRDDWVAAEEEEPCGNQSDRWHENAEHAGYDPTGHRR